MIAPLVAGLIPRKLVPEVVLLLVAGVVIGPHGANLAAISGEIDLLKQLGLGILFLLAGYEVETEELRGPGGRRAIVTWLVCVGLAFGVVGLIGLTGVVDAEVAVAIAVTSTALGTLLPILKDNNMLGATVGRAVLNHGAVGELGPVIAMAVLLGSRGAVGSLVALTVFALAAVVVGAAPKRFFMREGSRVLAIIRRGSETTSQTTVRLTMLQLVGLLLLASAFEFDVILGAFAAGLILRRLLPAGDQSLETKLEGLAFGLLIPVFFTTAGMAIDIHAVVAKPAVLVIFFALILLVRGSPVLIATRWDRTEPGRANGRTFSLREQFQVGLYGATGLPLIVVVTGVAVAAGQTSESSASILVAAGAVTVLVLPSTATLLERRGDPEAAVA